METSASAAPEGVIQEALLAGLQERSQWLRPPDHLDQTVLVDLLGAPPVDPKQRFGLVAVVLAPVLPLSRLASALAPWVEAVGEGGAFMLSTLGPGTLLDWRRALGLPPDSDPCGLDLHDLGDLLSQLGLAAPVTEADRRTLSYRHFETAIQDLRGLWRPPPGTGLAGRSLLRHRRQAFDSLRATDGRVYLEFELVFAHAWRGTPRPPNATGSEQRLTFQPKGRFG